MPKVSASSKVSAICGIGSIGEYLRIGIGGDFGIAKRLQLVIDADGGHIE